MSLVSVHHSCLFILWIWCSTLELAFFMNSPSSASHWYATMNRILQGVLWLIGRQEETRYEIGDRLRLREHIMYTNTRFLRFPLSSPAPVEKSVYDTTLPDDPPLGETKGGVLRLSHEGILSHEAPRIVIRNSIVDPVTGSIGVRFLDRSWDDHVGDCLHPECIDVTLHKQSPVDASPITVRRRTVITRVNGPLSQDY